MLNLAGCRWVIEGLECSLSETWGSTAPGSHSEPSVGEASKSLAQMLHVLVGCDVAERGRYEDLSSSEHPLIFSWWPTLL